MGSLDFYMLSSNFNTNTMASSKNFLELISRRCQQSLQEWLWTEEYGSMKKLQRTKLI